ncbi:MAG TPA: hypothetical protein VEN30_00995 [Paraburkholderia sp.]|nr:hypothetical protein [Paraburkholderia sp.]
MLLPLFALLKMIRRSKSKHGLAARFQTVLQRTGSAGIAVAGMYYLGLALAGAS